MILLFLALQCHNYSFVGKHNLLQGWISGSWRRVWTIWVSVSPFSLCQFVRFGVEWIFSASEHEIEKSRLVRASCSTQQQSRSSISVRWLKIRWSNHKTKTGHQCSRRSFNSKCSARKSCIDAFSLFVIWLLKSLISIRHILNAPLFTI